MITTHFSFESAAEPPLLVFVSSSITEFTAERQALHHAITGLGITRPWIFEYTPATTQPLEMSYLDKVRTCDFFMLLIDENVSAAVEMEFDSALNHHKPILAFLKKDKDEKDQYRSVAARTLINRIPTKWALFSNPTDLALKARSALTDEIIRRVRDGLITLPQDQVRHLENTESTLTRALSNLPPRRYTHLVGREEEIGVILERLLIPSPTAPPVIAITGLGGIGKTALAYEIVERAMLEGPFNGVVWESAKPEEFEDGRILRFPRPHSLPIESLVSTIVRQLGRDDLLQLPPSELQIRLQNILQTGSYLIVVDNLETIEAYKGLARQLHGLLSPSQSPRPSRALLTSRERLTGIPYIYDHYIRGLPKTASIQLIEQDAHDRGAPGILSVGPRLLDRMFEVTHGMPLALKLIVGQFIAGIPLDTELDRLEGAKEEELYEFIYMRSWSKLSVPAQKILIAAAAFASSVARIMLQTVSKTSDEEFDDAIPELVRMSLIEPSEHWTAAQRRYSIHPITRWFIKAPLRGLWERQSADTST